MALNQTPIFRAGQRTVIIAYVPLTVLLVELVVLGFLANIFGPKVVVLATLHLYPVIKTNEDLFWVTKMKVDFYVWVCAQKEHGVLTFKVIEPKNRIKP